MADLLIYGVSYGIQLQHSEPFHKSLGKPGVDIGAESIHISFASYHSKMGFSGSR
ncbi:MAG: hypothetical protein P0S93_02970 [Candidatus Neptunochlamydia sp.]|nr:hypothetical protein [Candidatus Neptunochlamydia sp.]